MTRSRSCAASPAPGSPARLAVIPHAAPVEAYEKRLDFELEDHRGHGLSGLFPDRRRLHQMGEGARHPRGARARDRARALVAYALTITDLDPLRYGLLFERFLNPERVSMPDFDIDFCQDRREEVIAYVQEKYGEATGWPRSSPSALHAVEDAAVRDVGRVLQMPYGQVRPALQADPGTKASSRCRSKQARAEEPKACRGSPPRRGCRARCLDYIGGEA